MIVTQSNGLLPAEERFKTLVIEAAEKSPCKKRKVGAVLVDFTGAVLGTGYNHPLHAITHQGNIASSTVCEDDEGHTLPHVIHAEEDAIENAKACSTRDSFEQCVLFVTHPPCFKCQEYAEKNGIKEIRVVGEFMKFDNNKLRYDLIPPEVLEALAEVLTYGAKKYKPNNWKTADNVDRYIAAFFRHFEAWRKGEEFDQESGKPHLYHALTNIAFITYFDMNRDK